MHLRQDVDQGQECVLLDGHKRREERFVEYVRQMLSLSITWGRALALRRACEG